MPTYYIDFEGGNDANAGTSFATRWKTFTNGATAARIAPGDTMRVMASPDPTSIGNATWTNGPRGATVSISSSTNATPIVITTSAAHGLVAGDYVTVAAHTVNTNANGVWKVGTVGSTTTFQILQIDGTNTTGNGVGAATGTIQKSTNCMVKLATPVTQNIALCGGLGQKPAWTTVTDIVYNQNVSQFKEGYSAGEIVIGAGFTTGKAAYYTLPSTLDLSSYQQISFWVRQTVGTVAPSGSLYLALCSDTTGDTVVNQINVPTVGAISTWNPITVNLGTNLGSSIQSIALYVVTDRGAETYVFDNIVACKATSSADSLNLTSLISKSNGTGDEAWYAIQSIDYDAIMLANMNSVVGNATTLRGYMGATETVTTYKRETIKTVPASSTSTSVNTMTESGTSTALTTYSGGWNRTDMSTQTGETWYDGQNGNGYGFAGDSFVNFVRTDKLNAVRYNEGWRITPASSYGGQIGSGRFTACSNGIATSGSVGNNFDTVWVNNNNLGMNLQGNCGTDVGTVVNVSNNVTNGISLNEKLGVFDAISQAHNNGQVGLILGSSALKGTTVGSITANNNGTYAVSVGANSAVIGGGSTTGNLTGGCQISTGTLFVSNFTVNETTEFAGYTTLGSFGGPAVYASRLDNVEGNNWVFAYNGTVNQQTAVVDSPATTAWKLSPTQATTANANTPVKLKLGTVVCAAGSLVTVTARMQRSNTGLTMRLVCPSGQISGNTTDISTNMTAAANTWETVTVTFTPTNAGGVDIYAYAFGGTTFSGYVCNLTVSQV